LLCLDVEAREHSTVLAEGLEAVRGKDTFENVGYLLLHIATGVVRFLEIRFQQFPAFVGNLLESEHLLQLSAHLHRAVPFVGIVYLLSILIHAGRYNMYMSAVYVLVEIDDVGLVAVTHLLHIGSCQIRKLTVGKIVVQRGIERYMQDRFLGIAVGSEVTLKGEHRLRDNPVRVIEGIGNHTVARYDATCRLVHLLLVVDNSSVE